VAQPAISNPPANSRTILFSFTYNVPNVLFRTIWDKFFKDAEYRTEYADDCADHLFDSVFGEDQSHASSDGSDKRANLWNRSSFQKGEPSVSESHHD
jgi:hypothetical protein